MGDQLMMEKLLAESVGVGVDPLRALRSARLKEGVHWRAVGRRVAYTAAGIEEVERLVREQMDVAAADKTLAPEGVAGATAGDQGSAGVMTAAAGEGGAVGVLHPGAAADVASLRAVAAAVAARPVEELRVVMTPRNPRMVLCRRVGGPDGEALQRVMVRSNENFLPGMAVRAKRSGDVWYLEGRCPRWRGRW